MALYRIRKIASTRDASGFGITIPPEIAHAQSGVSFSIASGDPFMDYRNKVVTEVNEIFHDLEEKATTDKQFQVVKQAHIILRESIITLNNPVQNCIILTSGARQ